MELRCPREVLLVIYIPPAGPKGVKLECRGLRVLPRENLPPPLSDMPNPQGTWRLKTPKACTHSSRTQHQVFPARSRGIISPFPLSAAVLEIHFVSGLLFVFLILIFYYLISTNICKYLNLNCMYIIYSYVIFTINI